MFLKTKWGQRDDPRAETSTVVPFRNLGLRVIGALTFQVLDGFPRLV